jgi:hypothetical protein
MKTSTITGTYGSHKTPCDVFTATERDGLTWYAVAGSQNVNCTRDELQDGVDVEAVADCDIFTWPGGIDSEEELENAVEA